MSMSNRSITSVNGSFNCSRRWVRISDDLFGYEKNILYAGKKFSSYGFSSLDDLNILMNMNALDFLGEKSILSKKYNYFYMPLDERKKYYDSGISFSDMCAPLYKNIFWKTFENEITDALEEEDVLSFLSRLDSYQFDLSGKYSNDVFFEKMFDGVIGSDDIVFSGLKSRRVFKSDGYPLVHRLFDLSSGDYISHHISSRYLKNSFDSIVSAMKEDHRFSFVDVKKRRVDHDNTVETWVSFICNLSQDDMNMLWDEHLNEDRCFDRQLADDELYGLFLEMYEDKVMNQNSSVSP